MLTIFIGCQHLFFLILLIYNQLWEILHFMESKCFIGWIERVFMEEPIVRSLAEDKLETCIDTLRDVLNEMCCTLDEHDMSIEKLIVSRQLDKLIVEYMVLKKNKYTDDVEVITHKPFTI